MWNRRLVVALLVLVCAWPTLSWAQQEIRSSSKGSSTPLPITGSAVDADHNALDVYPRGSGPNGESQVSLATLLACERLQDSATKGHCVIVDAANLSVVSTTSAVTIGGGVANDTYLKRIIVLAALTGTCVVTGFADTAGAAQSFTIPAAFVGERNFGGAKNSAGALTVTCSNAADDNLMLVEWWPAS